MDGRHQEYGEDVYTRGRHGRRPDPNYNAAMMRADRHVRSTIGRPFTSEDYQRTHGMAMPEPLEMGRFFRRGELPIRFAGFHASTAALAAGNTAPTPSLPPLVDRFEPDSEHEGMRGAHVVLADVVARSNAATGRTDGSDQVYPRAIQDILDHHYQGLAAQSTPEDRLRHVANTHRSLENLHPYIDANTRTNRLVLNRLLVENSLPPTILHSPLDVHHHTLDSWTEQIRAGQQTWQAHAAQSVDPAGAWLRHARTQELMAMYGLALRAAAPISASSLAAGPSASAAASAATTSAAAAAARGPSPGPAPSIAGMDEWLAMLAASEAEGPAPHATATAQAGATDADLEARLARLGAGLPSAAAAVAGPAAPSSSATSDDVLPADLQRLLASAPAPPARSPSATDAATATAAATPARPASAQARPSGAASQEELEELRRKLG